MARNAVSALLSVPGLAGLVIPAAAILLAGPATAAPPDPLAQKLVAGKLAELEAMLQYKWFDRAEAARAKLETIISATGTSNPVIQERLDKVKKALEAESAARSADAEAKRLNGLLARLKSADSRWPVDSYQVVRVRPDGTGDARTLAEGLAKSNDKDIIELHTGVYSVTVADLQGRGKDGRGGRASVFYAPRGEWPRLVAPPDGEFTVDQRKWVDGVELVAGSKAVGKWTVHASNCYLRALRPPPAPDDGPAGLVNADPDAADCVFQNFTAALAPGRNTTVRNNLFITCVTGIRGGREELKPIGCVFYRCLNATAGDRVSGEQCLFTRVKSAVEKGQFQRKDCVELDDPFRDPFRGDFRIRPDAKLPPGMSSVGPRWSDERWEMFIANFSRPLPEVPLSLGEARDVEAARAMNQVRKAVEMKDFQSAAEKLADIFGRFAVCPSIRRISSEVDKLAGDVLAEAVKESSPGGEDQEKARQLAAEYYRQATAAAAGGKKDEALDLARKAAQRDPENIEAQLLVAELLLDAGRPTQAEPFLTHGTNLIEASADRVSPAVKARQVQVQGKLARVARAGQDWEKFAQEQAGKFADVAGTPGLPSTVMSFRRALLCQPDNESYKTKLAEAARMVRPLTDSEAPDAEKARDLRAQADRQFASRQYYKAIELRRDAYKCDPGEDDLLFLARCYQRLQQAPQAAVLAFQARQQAEKLSDQTKGKRLVIEAIDLLRTVDPVCLRLEQMDQDFIRQAQLKARLAEGLNDKDTLEAINQLLDTLAKIDAAALNAAPSGQNPTSAPGEPIRRRRMFF